MLYSDYFELAGCNDKVEYSLSLDVEKMEHDLYIFDEADWFIFNQPKAFEAFIKN